MFPEIIVNSLYPYIYIIKISSSGLLLIHYIFHVDIVFFCYDCIYYLDAVSFLFSVFM
jgi:hypothetical protein